MQHLTWLDLAHNDLYEIDFDTFRNTKKLQVPTQLNSNSENSANNLLIVL